MVVYKVKFLGNGKVLVNGNYIQELESFIQACRDRDKEVNITHGRAYSGE